MKPTRSLAFLITLTVIATGCGGEEDKGNLIINVSGEGAARQGYPFVKNNETMAFVDGWQVQFSKFLVGLSELTLGSFDGTRVESSPETLVADLHLGDPVAVQFTDVGARRWDRFGFKIMAPAANARALNPVAGEDIARMAANGFNYWIEGSASKNGQTYSFAWGLKNPTRNRNCTNGLDGTDGFVIRANTTTQAEITIHVDHMFWDTLGSEKANLRFDAIAGASQDDFVITFEDLATQPLASPRAPGGQPVTDANGKALLYNPGSLPLTAPNLAAFVLASAASQAHVNGVGLCTISSL